MVVATSGGYAYQPTIADLVSEAYERCGQDPANLTSRHIVSALRSLNLLFVEMETEAGDMLFRQDRITATLTTGDRGLLLPVGTLAVTGAWLSRGSGDTIRRNALTLIAEQDWERISQQTQTGFPSQYFVAMALPGETSEIHSAVTAVEAPAWGPGTNLDTYASDRLVLVFWPGTDTTGDTLTYTRIRQVQDAQVLAQNPDMPRQWFEALHAGLAAKLAVKWAPERLTVLQAQYGMALGVTKKASRDRSPISFGLRGIGSPGRRRRL